MIEGGFLDIDVRVTGPDGEEVISRERESNGKITFAAAKIGTYTYCFSNKMSTMTPKGVMFSMDVGEPQAAAADGEGNGVIVLLTLLFINYRKGLSSSSSVFLNRSQAKN